MVVARLLTIEETAQYLTDRLGVGIPVETLRTWRKTWLAPDGARRGPEPLLITPRKLRYRADQCDEFITARLAGVRPVSEASRA